MLLKLDVLEFVYYFCIAFSANRDGVRSTLATDMPSFVHVLSYNDKLTLYVSNNTACHRTSVNANANACITFTV